MNPSDTTPLTQDERILAAVAHASILLPMMGLFAPLIIWILQKEKSRFVAFQALQALAYQLVKILAYMLGMACYMGAFLALFLGTIPLSGAENPETFSPLVGLAVFLPFLVLGFIGVGAVIFLIYGLVAAVLAYQGKPFRYVIIGRLLERSMQSKPVAPSAAP